MSASSHDQLPNALIELLEELRDPVLVTDFQLDLPGPRILYANQRSLQLTGFDRESLIGRTPHVLECSEAPGAERQRLRQSMLCDSVYFGVLRNQRRSGEHFDMWLTVGTLRAPFRPPIGFAAVQAECECGTVDDGPRQYAFVLRASRVLTELNNCLGTHAPQRIDADGALVRGRLTARQHEVAKLLLEGSSVFDVAVALSISVETVRNHRAAIYRRLRVHSQAELIGRFQARGG